MKRVLVTGATGFIGRNTLSLLAARGFAIHAVTHAQLPESIQQPVTWHRANLLRQDDRERLVKDVKATHLLHLAWYAIPGAFWMAIDNVEWAEATIGLVRTFVAHGGVRIVAAGTCAEYGEVRGDRCSEYSTPIAPRTTYGVCKSAAAELVLTFATTADVSAAWGRVFHLFGPFEPEARFVPTVITSLLRGKPANCTHGRQVRDMLHVTDVANAFVALLDSEVTGPVNIASGTPVTLLDVARYIGTALRAEQLVHMGALTANRADPPRLVGDVERLATEVQWRPKLSLQEGLDQTISWWRAREAVP